jgi:uncharacterized protein
MLCSAGHFVEPEPVFENPADQKAGHACVLNDPLLLQQALSAGAKAGLADQAGHTLLMFAAEAGAADCIRLLLKEGADVNASSRNKANALTWAAANGRLEALTRLLAAGAKTNQPGGNERSALAAAANGGHLEVVAALLAAKADSRLVFP